MTTHSMSGAGGARSTSGDRALRWIGDLDHPFYSDERNRYVWYEASAIGFQLLFLCNYFVAGIALWVAGADALPYAAAFMVPTLITAFVFQGYLKTRSAEYWPGKNDLVRRRGQLAVVSMIVVASGLVRAVLDLRGGESSGGPVAGLIVGIGIGTGAAVAGLIGERRKQNNAEQLDEF